jgi:hypothetical protein
MSHHDHSPEPPAELLSPQHVAELHKYGFATLDLSVSPTDADIATLIQGLAISQGQVVDEYQSTALPLPATGDFLPATYGTDNMAFVITGGQGSAGLIRGRHSTRIPIHPGTLLLVQGQTKRFRSFKDQTWIKFDCISAEPMEAVTVTTNAARAIADTQQNTLSSLGALGRRAYYEEMARQGTIMERHFNRRMRHRLGKSAIHGT